MFLTIFYPILAFSLIVFFRSFFLGFGGDDYFGLLDYLKGLDGHNLINIKFFLWQYGPQDTLFGILYKIFGLNPTPYFIFSYLLRIIAAMSFYPVMKLFTKSKRAIFLPILFFSITFAGIETTSWSFNMMAYLAIAILNLFFYNLILYKETGNKKRLTISVLLFTLAIILSPTRMGGLVIFVMIFGGIYLIYKNVNLKNISMYILESILLLLGFAFILYVGNSLANGNSFSERLQNLIPSSSANQEVSAIRLLSQNKFKILSHPIEQLGAIIYPTNNQDNYAYVQSNPYKSALKLFIIFSIVHIIVTYSIFKKPSIPQIAGLTISFLLSILFVPFMKANPYTFPIGITLIWFLCGSYFLITAAILICYSWINNQRITLLYILAIIWTLSSIFVFWNRFPESVQPTYHRYLITPVVGVTYYICALISQTNKYKTAVSILILTLIFAHVTNTMTYLKELKAYRNKQLSQNIISSFPNIKTLEKSSVVGHPLVFYLYSENPKALYHNVLFGFPPMVAITQNLNYYPNLVYTDNWQEIVSAYTDGSSLKRFSWNTKPVPIENIYAYELKGDELVDMTYVNRNKLVTLEKR